MRAGINSKVSGRELRRHLRASNELLDDAVPVLSTLLENEEVTIAKVTALEAWRDRGLWGRLVWLATGK